MIIFNKNQTYKDLLPSFTYMTSNRSDVQGLSSDETNIKQKDIKEKQQQQQQQIKTLTTSNKEFLQSLGFQLI